METCTLECCKCKKQSPPIPLMNYKLPDGWKTLVVGDPQKKTETSFVCPECP